MVHNPDHIHGHPQRALFRSLSPALLFPCLVLLLSSTDLLGWLVHLPLLTSVIPHSSTMKPNTAISLFLLATVCLLRLQREGSNRRTLTAAVIVAFALLISCGTLIEYASGSNPGLDQLFLSVPVDAFGDPPGRMAFGTATCLSLIGFSLLLLDKVPFFSTWTLLAVNSMAASALISFVLNRGPLFGIPWMKSLAVHTALSLLLLTVAALASRPEREPISSLLRHVYREGRERWTAAVLTVVPSLVALPAVIAMRTGFLDAGLTLIGIFLVLFTLQMISQLRDALNLREGTLGIDDIVEKE